MKSTTSQKKSILEWLKTHEGITPLEALDEIGCFRLGGRICELRQEGWPIETEMVQQNGKRFAKYLLKGDVHEI